MDEQKLPAQGQRPSSVDEQKLPAQGQRPSSVDEQKLPELQKTHCWN